MVGACLHDPEKSADPIDLYIHRLAEQLEALHCFGARLAMLFDLILNLIEQRVKLAIQLKQRMIRGNQSGRRDRTSCPLKRNQRCSLAGHRIS
jgi:hypothetical protein